MSRTHILLVRNHLQGLRNNLLAVRMTCKTLEGRDNGGEGGGGIIHHEIVQHVHSAVCDIVTSANGDIQFNQITLHTHIPTGVCGDCSAAHRPVVDRVPFNATSYTHLI